MSVILTYNINGIRSALRKDFDTWIHSTDADIICLQEIKANTDQFDESVFSDLGYHCYCSKKRQWCGYFVRKAATSMDVE